MSVSDRFIESVPFCQGGPKGLAGREPGRVPPLPAPYVSLLSASRSADDGGAARVYVAGDEVAEKAGRAYEVDEVTEEEDARIYAAFGLRVPDEEREAGTPKNLELNSHGMELMRRVDIVDQLSRIDAPTLVSVGELDPRAPVAAAEEIIGALPEGVGQFEVIAGAGHFTWLDAPDRFWPIIIEFVHRTTGRAPVQA
jgi:pimeloyl-ACP methyl ester carboxylesterase